MRRLIAVLVSFAGAHLAPASLILYYQDQGTSNIDESYENLAATPGYANSGEGFLREHFDLPAINLSSSSTSTTVLPQLESAVGQIRDGSGGNGLHLPTSSSGIPHVPNGAGQSSGVLNALTNYATMGTGTNGGGTLTGSVPNNVRGTAFTANFTFSRTIDTSGRAFMTYQIVKNPSGTPTTTTWVSALEPDTNRYFSAIDAIQIRLRSTSGNTISLSNLTYSDGTVTNQILGNLLTAASLYEGAAIQPSDKTASIVAETGEIAIRLLAGVAAGNFTLSGQFSYTGTGGFNHQIKGLAFSNAIPEPTTWAAFVGASCLFVALVYRRRGQGTPI